ncbi:MAG: N-acetyltransferase [Bacteroidales bacterium]
MAIQIKEVANKQELKAFVLFPLKLYKDCKYFVPQLISQEMKTLDRDINPSFEVCETKLWLAYINDKIVGRIAGIIHKPFIEKWGNRYARFGWFDFIDSEEVANALLQTVENWAGDNGMEAIHGPLGFTDFDPEGILIEGFSELSTIVERYNYPYYACYLEKYGYYKDADWVEYEVEIPSKLPEKFLKVSDFVQRKQNLKIAKLNSLHDVMPYVDEIFAIINNIYGLMYGFTPVDEKQTEFYLKQYFKLVNPEFVSVVLDKNNKVVAFGVTMPSYSKAMQKAKGKLYPFGFYHLNKASKKNDTIDMYFIGIRPDFQNKGVLAVMFCDLANKLIAKGFKKAETNVEFESNEKMQNLWSYFERRQHKRRRSYFKYLVSKPRGEDATMI